MPTTINRPAPPVARNALVTGSAGFIGSRLATRLLDEGWTVVGVDSFTDSYDPREKVLRARALGRRAGYRHVARDLAAGSLAAELADVQVVFHLAGRPGVRDSFSLAAKYQHDNVTATEQLLADAQAAGSVRRLVYASSSSVYGDAALPFREDGPTAPISPYGQTKLAAEQLCLLANGPELETVALRYFTVYGPGQRPDMGLRRFAESALAGRPIRLFGDGTQSRDFTFVDDVVEATRAAADAPVAGLAVNVGGGSRISLNEVFELLGRLVGRVPVIEAEPFARGDARHTGAQLDRAAGLLGFRGRVSFADGYAAEVEWLRASQQSRMTA